MDPLYDIRITFEDGEVNDDGAFSIVLRDAQIRLLEQCDYFIPIVSAKSKWNNCTLTHHHVTWPRHLGASILKVGGGNIQSISEIHNVLTTIFAPKDIMAPLSPDCWMFLFQSHSFLGCGKLLTAKITAHVAFDIPHVCAIFEAWITVCMYVGVEELTELCGAMMTVARDFADGLYRARKMDVILLAERIASICADLSGEFLAAPISVATSTHVREFAVTLLAPHRNLNHRTLDGSIETSRDHSMALLSRVTDWGEKECTQPPCTLGQGIAELKSSVSHIIRDCTYNGEGEPYEIAIAGGAALASAMYHAKQYTERLKPSDIDVFLCGDRTKITRVMMAVLQQINDRYTDCEITFQCSLATITCRLVDGGSAEVQVILSALPSMAAAILIFDRTYVQWCFDGYDYWCSPEYLLCHRERVCYNVSYSLNADTAIKRLLKMQAKGYTAIPVDPYWRRPLFHFTPYEYVLDWKRVQVRDWYMGVRDYPLKVWCEMSRGELEIEVASTDITYLDIDVFAEILKKPLHVCSWKSRSKIVIDNCVAMQSVCFSYKLVGPMRIIPPSRNSSSSVYLQSITDVAACRWVKMVSNGHTVMSDSRLFYPSAYNFADDVFMGAVHWTVDAKLERMLDPTFPLETTESCLHVGDIVTFTIRKGSRHVAALVKHTGVELEHIERVLSPVASECKRKSIETPDESEPCKSRRTGE